MLEDAKGTNCQASNFCKVIGRKSQGVCWTCFKLANMSADGLRTATALGLIDFTAEGVAPEYATMIQQFNRFILEEFTMEGNMKPNPLIVGPSVKDQQGPTPPSPTTQLFGIHSRTLITCGNCGATTERISSTHVVDLIYPRRVRLLRSSSVNV